jgi:hypothetical protein
MHEHRRDLVPVGSENDKLQASGIFEVLRRFGTCRDHRSDSSLLVALVAAEYSRDRYPT